MTILTKWQAYFKHELYEIDELTLRRRALADNIRRGRLLAAVIICFELIFIFMDISTLLMHISDRFHHLSYLFMYVAMVIVNLLFLYLTRKHESSDDLPPAAVRCRENCLFAYMSFCMVWGSLISLIDQRLYGQLIVFMICMIIDSVVFVANRKQLLIPYALASVLLLAGLPFFQTSKDILVGHYVNLAVFICIAWIASRLLYQAYVRNLACNLELARINRLLAAESAQNQLFNDKLSQANFQLQQLSLVDELTGLANRHGLRNFINQIFERSDVPVVNLSVIMIDIDHFKQYNDRYGHLAGDQVLSAIAGVLAGLARESRVIAARWGGEEFIVLAFNANAAELVKKAELIRLRVEELSIIHDCSLTGEQVTVSIGTSLQSVHCPSDVGPVIESADIAMYEAKKSGRNQVRSSLQESGIVLPDSEHENELLPTEVRITALSTREQAEQIAELARKIWTEHYTPIIGAAQVDYMLFRFQSADRIWQDIQEQGYRYDLVEIRGEPAGYMASRPDTEKNAFFLSKLYIDRKFRRRGLSRLLLRSLISRCEDAGRHRIWLTVNKSNYESILAYEKLGFARTDAVVSPIGGGYTMDDYIMEMNWQ